MQVCTLLQTDNHASSPPLSFFTGWMPFLSRDQKRQSTEGTIWQTSDCISVIVLKLLWVSSDVVHFTHACIIQHSLSKRHPGWSRMLLQGTDVSDVTHIGIGIGQPREPALCPCISILWFPVGWEQGICNGWVSWYCYWRTCWSIAGTGGMHSAVNSVSVVRAKEKCSTQTCCTVRSPPYHGCATNTGWSVAKVLQMLVCLMYKQCAVHVKSADKGSWW